MSKKAGNEDKADTPGKKVRLRTATMLALSGLACYGGVKAIAATAQLPIIARLVRAVDVTVNTTLDFGTLAITSDRAGQATLDPELNRLTVDSGGSLTLAGGKPAAGRLQIKGADYPVAVSIEDASVKMTNGTDTVLVTNFNLQTANGGMKMTFTPTKNTYSFTVPVGGTIRTRQNQISGTYTGTTRIFASYQ